MSQKTNKLYRILSYPTIYSIFQKLMKGDKIRKKILKTNVIKKNPIVLDIGCGLGDSLEYIDNPVYFGYDISQDYINYAKKKYGKKGFFFCRFIASDSKK